MNENTKIGNVGNQNLSALKVDTLPSAPYDGQVVRFNHEVYYFDDSTGRWIGEMVMDGYGDTGSLGNGQYFRRYNGMATGSDRGLILPYDILIVEHGANWQTPNNNTGSIEILSNSTIFHSLDTTGDEAHEYPMVVVTAGSVISFRRNGGLISNTQGFIKFKKLL